VKRLFVASATVVAAGILAVLFLWPRANAGPEPIAYGREACAQCRMLITQPGFGGEMRDHRGVLTKYDDVGCLLRAMLGKHDEMPEAWVEDHTSGELVPLLTATLIRTPGGGTPMGHGIVAFADQDAAGAFAAEHGGEAVALEDLVRDSARLARSSSAGQPRVQP